MPTIDEIQGLLSGLSPSELAQVSEYIEFLRWRSGNEAQTRTLAETYIWRQSLIERFAGADVRSSGSGAGMEVKIAEAAVDGVLLPALWQHPPVQGESIIEYHVPIPKGLRDLTLRFAIGIRDGATADERLVAFRIRLDGWQVWSRACWPRSWQMQELPLPLQAGDVLRLSLCTDGLGDHSFAWAVWGEPVLLGRLENPAEPAA